MKKDMMKPSQKCGTEESKDKFEMHSNKKETDNGGKNSISQKADEKTESSANSDFKENKASDLQPIDSEKNPDSDAESHNFESLSFDANSSEKTTDSLLYKGDVYYIDDVVNKGGYGKFQHLVTFLSGVAWFPDAFEAIILSFIGGFLACDWKLYRWQNALLSSVVFLGMTVGAPAFGAIADIYGRRKAIGISLFSVFVFGSVSALSKNFTTILVVRCLTGFALGGVAQGGTLCSEYCPAIYRGIAGFYLSYYWAIGTIILILGTWGIMEALDSWRWLLFAASLPALAVLLALRWYPESARYHLVSHKPEEAVKQLENLASMNKIEMPKGHLILPEETEALGRIWDLLKPEHRVSTLLMWYIWFAVAFSYYGFALIAPIIITNGKLRVPKEKLLETFEINSTSNFLHAKMPCKKLTRLNYIDLLWTSAAEFPGLVAFTLLVKLLNRRTLLSGSCFLTTLITFLLLVDTDYRNVANILLFFGRANLIAIYQLSFIMTLETFPTTLRAVAMGTGSGLARFGGAVVPYTAQLLVISHPIIAVCIVGLVIFLAAVAAALLPIEMKDIKLKEISG